MENHSHLVLSRRSHDHRLNANNERPPSGAAPNEKMRSFILETNYFESNAGGRSEAEEITNEKIAQKHFASLVLLSLSPLVPRAFDEARIIRCAALITIRCAGSRTVAEI